MTSTIIKNSLEMSYKLVNDLGKEVKRVNSIEFDKDATEANMLAVSIAAAKVMKYSIVNTINVKKTDIVE